MKTAKKYATIAGVCIQNRARQGNMSDETCKYCKRKLNITKHPEGYSTCNYPDCRFVTYPKNTEQYFYEKATGEKAENYKPPDGGFILPLDKEVRILERYKTSHKYIESTNFLGKIIEQKDLVEM